VDPGLGGFLRSIGETPSIYEPQMGKIGFPTVRNIALTSPYFHNGVFRDLKTVVHFFNTRDVPGSGFDPPEAPVGNISKIIGNLGLTDDEEDAIVAFMETLTDDYSPVRGRPAKR
jgi:cytochrome c peroxidase